MNAFVKKELRLLWPIFLAACLLACSNWLLPIEKSSLQSMLLILLPTIICPAAVMLLAVNSFGGEVAAGTLANLLVQPVPRQKIWNTKIAFLAVALLLVSGLQMVSFRLQMELRPGALALNAKLGDWFLYTAFFTVAVFSGGLWSVLLLRQVAAAFWFALLVPAALVTIISGFFAGGDHNLYEGMVEMVIGLYSLGGFLFARWLFFRAQDLAWAGGNITMPELRWSAIGAGSVRRWSPRLALWRKELLLQQSQLVIALSLGLLHLGVLAVRHFGTFAPNSATLFVLKNFWGIWLLLPLLVGCAAVAEERKLGTQASQFCLPVRQRTQFRIKLAMVLGLSLLFGFIVPLMLEGTRILPDHFVWAISQLDSQIEKMVFVEPHMSPLASGVWFLLQLLDQNLSWLAMASLAAGTGLVAMYASSLARNTLQAVAPATLGALLAMFLIDVAVNLSGLHGDWLWAGPLHFFIGVPMMVGALIWFTADNFRRLSIEGRDWGRSVMLILLALVVAIGATSATYHRIWERLTPFEPAHGAARLSQAQPVKLEADLGRSLIQLPSGQVWQGRVEKWAPFDPLASVLSDVGEKVFRGKYLPGSNWLQVADAGHGWMGIKTDGTLWVSPESPHRELREWRADDWMHDWSMNQAAALRLEQFGTETNWSSLRVLGRFALLVKTDGTLWQWGMWQHSKKDPVWRGFQALTPEQVGVESNWAEVFNDHYDTCLRQRDGSVWLWPPGDDAKAGTRMFAPGFYARPMPGMGQGIVRSMATISPGMEFKVGVLADGTFRILARQNFDLTSHRVSIAKWEEANQPFEGGTNWVAVAGTGGKLVTLRNDGSLWLWNITSNHRNWFDTRKVEKDLLRTKPVRLGSRTDWVALTGDYTGVYALAADGGLWYWPLERAPQFDGEFVPLLDFSRKPQKLANIFKSAAK